MKIRKLIAILVGFTWATVAYPLINTGSIGDDLRNRLATPERAVAVTENGQRVGLHAGRTLAALYARNGWRPLWLAQGRPGAAAMALYKAVSEAGRHGLRPRDYHAEALGALLAMTETGPSAARLGSLELLLSDAFLGLGADL